MWLEGGEERGDKSGERWVGSRGGPGARGLSADGIPRVVRNLRSVLSLSES